MAEILFSEKKVRISVTSKSPLLYWYLRQTDTNCLDPVNTAHIEGPISVVQSGTWCSFTFYAFPLWDSQNSYRTLDSSQLLKGLWTFDTNQATVDSVFLENTSKGSGYNWRNTSDFESDTLKVSFVVRSPAFSSSNVSARSDTRRGRLCWWEFSGLEGLVSILLIERCFSIAVWEEVGDRLSARRSIRLKSRSWNLLCHQSYGQEGSTHRVGLRPYLYLKKHVSVAAGSSHHRRASATYDAATSEWPCAPTVTSWLKVAPRYCKFNPEITKHASRRVIEEARAKRAKMSPSKNGYIIKLKYLLGFTVKS